MSDNTVLDRQDVAAKKNTVKIPRDNVAVYDPSIDVPSVDAPAQDRSPYLVKRLLETNERNLFNHVKFNLVKQQIDALRIATPKVLDIGCGLQVAHSYLSDLNLECQYFGVDYEPNFSPGAVVDLLNIDANPPELPWAPDVVLMLDVLEHLHEDITELDKIVASIKNNVCAPESIMIFTLPQMYRLDRFKLSHLHYPEHKIRLTQQEWVQVIEPHFEIESVRGFGYLSVIPYLPMASKRYTPDNRLGKLFNYLRGHFFEWGPFKPIDLWLSKMLGGIPGIKQFSNDINIVARPRK
jgi:SAM-dependent methyltransferase